MGEPYERVGFWARPFDPYDQGQFGSCRLHGRVGLYGRLTRACEPSFTDLFAKVTRVTRDDCEPTLGSFMLYNR
ncbi:hypothetical protein J1N35_000123 [Gossypium stocksii]|uniref:Uncharacterized protein n=1 Tax=Gossypium stocksii TaxID=47602 RepID=A0A9D4AIC9_9ROSI|nr:hypothetical protein J1N35_000123 [Gossypium stocksii]